MGVSFDCFGTLVTTDRPEEPWTAVATALRSRDVAVPADWEAAYRTGHREYEPGAEAPLDEHVRLALASRGVDVAPTLASEATLAAFDAPVTVRDGADAALEAAAESGPVAVCSNCSVPGLLERTLERAGLAGSADAVVASADCGWRKPHPAVFETVADELGVDLAELVHVGDDARTDGGAERAGATTVLLSDCPLPELTARLGSGSSDRLGSEPSGPLGSGSPEDPGREGSR